MIYRTPLFAYLIVLCFAGMSIAPGVGRLRAQGAGMPIQVDPFARGVVSGDPSATFDQACNTFVGS